MVIKTLNERGLIERAVNREDKRRMRLKLSATGRRLLIEIAPTAARAQERVLRRLPPKSRAVFLDMLVTFLTGHDALINIDEVLAGVSVPDRKALQRPPVTRRSAIRNSSRRTPSA
jgi:hypothetical protein